MDQSIVSTLEKLYLNLESGNLASAANTLPEAMTFNVSGKSALAGKYSRDTFLSGFVTKLRELSGGTLKMEIHDVMGAERHATVLLSYSLKRGEKSFQIRTVHVWRIEDGAPFAGYEYPRDMYQYDEAFN